MNKHDVLLLQQIRQYPSLTITLPTHRTVPDNQQDPIRLRNLLSEATDRVLGEFSKREVDGLLTNLEQIAATVDHQQNLDGLVLFVNQELAQAHRLPFTVPERVLMDEGFATRDLVLALNRTVRYWVLALSENATRLYEATRDSLVEVTGEGFPMVHTGPGGQTALPAHDVNVSAYRDERHRQFFRAVDEQVGLFMKDDPLPLVLLGVDRYLSFYAEVGEYAKEVVAEIQGNYDKHSTHELAEVVWPVAKEALLAEHMQVLELLNTAVGERRIATTIDDIWRSAKEGRGRMLLVEENYHFPGQLDETGWVLTVADDPTAPDVLDDAVDDIIEQVLEKGGQVKFLPDGTLADYQSLVLLLRY
jgi:hypothetical protein